jgi:hypothetical protein
MCHPHPAGRGTGVHHTPCAGDTNPNIDKPLTRFQLHATREPGHIITPNT